MSDLAPTTPTEAAQQLWQTSKPVAGTPVAIYLNHCGITIEPPRSLRYHPARRHDATGLYLPAMLAKVVNSDGVPIGIHSIFLRMDGRGRAGVATIEITLGPCAGGGVYLGRPAPAMAVAIEVEAGLAAVQASGAPAVAALSADNLRVLDLPTSVRDVVTIPAGGGAGQQAIRIATQRFEQEGRRVRMGTTPNDIAGEAGV